MCIDTEHRTFTIIIPTINMVVENSITKDHPQGYPDRQGKVLTTPSPQQCLMCTTEIKSVGLRPSIPLRDSRSRQSHIENGAKQSNTSHSCWTLYVGDTVMLRPAFDGVEHLDSVFLYAAETHQMLLKVSASGDGESDACEVAELLLTLENSCCCIWCKFACRFFSLDKGAIEVQSPGFSLELKWQAC
ncbi:hypothetical protein Nepgr_022877 [Nepenthes gracilis]|uniref:Uncharacterized protein n=1 Tax=Nepenthes gracilis TaxID=150966 RepID=A0AAD3T0A1_NEPGR|nr:hypothetical protein Nepgr_022877 [Nepenthes gracilis]